MEFQVIDPSARVRRKRHKPWVFLFVDHWQSARMRLFGERDLLQRACDELAAEYLLRNPPDAEPLIAGVALVERSLDEGEAPRILAAYYGPGDYRNTAIAANDNWPGEQKAIVRSPWGSDDVAVPMAARGLEQP